MAGEAAAPRAVRRSAAAAGLTSRRELRPDGPQARGSGAAAAEARRAARVGVRARGRGSQGGRAHDAESAAAVAASEASLGPGGWTRRGREARAGGPARDSDLGDQEVPAAALGPGDLEIKINLVADGSEQIEFFYLRYAILKTETLEFYP